VVKVSRGYGYRRQRYYPQRRNYTIYALRDIVDQLCLMNKNLAIIIKILNEYAQTGKQGGEARKNER